MVDVSQPTAARTTFGAVSFVAGIGECEEKTVALKIDNVAEFLAMSNSDLFLSGLIFEAGKYTRKDGNRAAANWKYYFYNTKENGEDWIGGNFYFYTGGSNIKSAKAWHSVSLSSGGNLITSYARECKEFAEIYTCVQPKLITKSELLEKTEETNALEVNLLVKVFSNQGFTPVLQEARSSPLEPTQMRGQMTSVLLKMLESGEGGDIDVMVPSEVGEDVDESSYTKKVHKGILMAQSSVFSKMFGKDSTMIEAKTGKVIIKDLSPLGLDIFLRYLYTGEVLADWVKVLPELLNAAEKYDCGKLKQFCGHNLLSAVTTANAFKMLKLAKLHSLSFAAKGVMEFIQKKTIAVFTEDVIHKVSDSDVLEIE